MHFEINVSQYPRFVAAGRYSRLGSTFAVLDDRDVTSCLSTQSATSSLRHPLPQWLRSTNVTLSLTLRRRVTSASCARSDYDVIAFTHVDTHLRATKGDFRACDVTEDLMEGVGGGESGSMRFECFCSYGVCEYIFTTIVHADADASELCVELCEVDIS